MKRTFSFFLILTALSALGGYLLSKASLVGRMGISLLYKQYSFLKVWWQAGLLLLFVWVLFFILQGWAQRRLPALKAKLVHIGAIFLALIGLFFTYQDFRDNLSHRWLGERFHLGGYLFWIGWMLVSLFYLTGKSKPVSDTLPTAPLETELEPGKGVQGFENNSLR
ncbi:cytochrome d ubiquinol oxidase subunit II [Flavisolibacter sp. BT320]|nr:cytochrome d ubiquinol oxidase subunit II [Flavisolibacter longurius]